MKYPIRLVMADFDWTLFRSPLPPGGKEKTWWASPASLTPPIVPLRPGKEWWIQEVVKRVKRDQRREDTIVAIVTGRNRKVEDRVARLIEQKLIRPDYLLTHDAKIRGEKQILKFKVNSVKEILDVHPTISELIVWEDLQTQLDELRKLSSKRGIEYEPHLVTELEQQLWTP